MDVVQQELVRQLEKFRLEKIEPLMAEDDKTGKFRWEIYHQLGALGMATSPQAKSENALRYHDYVLGLEEIGKSSVSYAVTLSVSAMVQNIILTKGSEEQKKNYLPPLAKGDEIGAFCLSESSAGSDAGALQARATKATHKGEKGFTLQGRKMWVTSAGLAKTYLVMALSDEKKISAFLVRDGQEGFSYGKKEEKLGWHISPTREIVFENCFIPESNLLGGEGEGLKLALAGLGGGRINIGAIAVGLAQRALDDALAYSLSRQQFGQSIFNFQGLQWMMAEMATEIESARALVEKAAKMKDEETPCRQEASMAKLKATEVAMRVTTDAVQILGGVGHTTEYPLERFMRDAKILQIVEGSNQIQKNIIAKELKNRAT